MKGQGAAALVVIRRAIHKKDINFLPPELAREFQKQKQLFWGLLAIIMTGIAAGGAAYLLHSNENYYEQMIAQHRFYLSQLEAGRPYYEQWKALQSEYQRNLAAVETIRKQERSLVGIINSINQIIPPGVRVIEMEVDASWGVRIKFEAENALEAARMIVGLRQLGVFAQVEPVEVPLSTSSKSVVEIKMPFKLK